MDKPQRRQANRLLIGVTVFVAGWCSHATAGSIAVSNLSQLRTAIQQANTSPGLDVITLAPGTYTFSATATPDSGRGQINPLDGDLDITDDLVIWGNGAVIDANLRDRIFYIQGTSATLVHVTIHQLTLRNGQCDPSASMAPGGAIFAWLAALTLDGCTITSNSAQEDGGGVAVFGYYDDATDTVFKSSLTLNSTNIDNNQGENGGGIVTCLADLSIQGGDLLGNTAPAASGTFGGGGLLATGNNCRADAGARYLISRNSSGGSGGGLGLFGITSGSLAGCAVSDNLAAGSGGGINLFETSPVLTNCILTSNTAAASGGAINCYTLSSPVVMNCTISGNTLSGAIPLGGGMYLRDGSHPVLVNSIFEGNNDWAVFADSNATPAILASCLFFNNGGALTDPIHGGYLDSEMNRLNTELAYASGNRTGSPVFANQAAGDLHILFSRAALDQGTSRTLANGRLWTAPLTDRDGTSRPVDFPGIGRDGPGEGYDIGAYELRRPSAPVMAAEPAFTKGTTNSLSWSAVTSATAYTMEWSTNGSFVPLAGSSGWIAPTTRLVTGLLNGQTYLYRVKCRDTYLTESAWSNVVSSRQDATPPTAPGTPQASGGFTSLTSVMFTWSAATDAISGVASYDLQVGTTPGGSNVFNANVGNVLARKVVGLNGQTLYARVRARDRVGNIGPWSGNSAGVTVDTVAPRLIGAAAPDYMDVIVTFNEPVRNADQAGNYTCTRGLLILGGFKLSGTRYKLYTSAQTPGTSYTVTVVGSRIQDLAANPVDSRYRSRSFRGGGRTSVRAWELYR